jgi:hypothetical protein
MSESAWQVIIKAYERELANAKTPEEAARWQAAIDNSLTEANKEVIVSEGRVRPTPEQKARRIELGKEKAAVADQQRLIDEGRINIFSAEESEAMYRADAETVRRKPIVNTPAPEPIVAPQVDPPMTPVQRRQAAINRASVRRLDQGLKDMEPGKPKPTTSIIDPSSEIGEIAGNINPKDIDIPPSVTGSQPSSYIDEVGDIFDDISVRCYGRRYIFC